MRLDQGSTDRNKHVAGFSTSVYLRALCNSGGDVELDN